MINYGRRHYEYGDGSFDQKNVVAPRLRCDGGIRPTMIVISSVGTIPDCD